MKETFSFYGGAAGNKKAIIYDGEVYMLKFPKNLRGFKNVELSYSTSPLSEYIGSNIYNILGLPVHHTLLGLYDEKLVVACKDFCYSGLDIVARLTTIDLLKNNRNSIDDSAYNFDNRIVLSELLNDLGSHIITEFIDMELLLERFWVQFIVDALLMNNDRNNGNWGFLTDITSNTHSLAPIFDNGGSFSVTLTPYEMNTRLSGDTMNILCKNTTSVYFTDKYKNIRPYTFIRKNQYDILDKVAIGLVPKINLTQIIKFINNIPNEVSGVEIISDFAKEFFIVGLELRYEHILLHLLELAKGRQDSNTMHLF